MSRCNSRPIIITYNPESKGSWVQYFYETHKKTVMKSTLLDLWKQYWVSKSFNKYDPLMPLLSPKEICRLIGEIQNYKYKPKTVMKYKKGDKVRVIGRTISHDYIIGHDYSIDYYDKSNQSYKLICDISSRIWIRDEDLEPDMSNTPEVGDSIEMLCDLYKLKKGQIYPVIEVESPDYDGNMPCKIDIPQHPMGFQWPYKEYYKLIKKKTMEFSKKDLKTGDVLVFDNGEACVVFKDLRSNKDCCSDGKQVWFPLTHLSDDFVREIGGYKVVSVYSPESNYDTGRIRCRNNLVWEREEEVTDITLEEIAEKFGKDVKNIRIKD